jgi:hypothetical protein
MNSHVHRYYRKFVDEELPIHPFHDVIALHDNRSAKWEDISKKVPSLPKGWFELARLTTKDRIDFSRDYWLETLPFVPHVHSFLHDFFADLDDVGIFLTQKTFDHPYQCEMVYSLLDGSCFFHGNPPCPDQQIASTNHLFNEDLPLDYLAFLKIHDGFCKYTDTGIIPTQKLAATHKHLTETIQRGFWEIMTERSILLSSSLFMNLLDSGPINAFIYHGSLWVRQEIFFARREKNCCRVFL